MTEAVFLQQKCRPRFVSEVLPSTLKGKEDIIFSNIQDVDAFHRLHLLPQLKERATTTDEAARVFIECVSHPWSSLAPSPLSLTLFLTCSLNSPLPYLLPFYLPLFSPPYLPVGCEKRYASVYAAPLRWPWYHNTSSPTSIAYTEHMYVWLKGLCLEFADVKKLTNSLQKQFKWVWLLLLKCPNCIPQSERGSLISVIGDGLLSM